jgi:hypothetical protein
MSFFRAFTLFAGAMSDANRFSTLFDRSDAELIRRGFDRDGLRSSFIAGLSRS